MAKNSTVANSKTFTDLLSCQTVHGEFKDFFSTRS